MEKKNEERNRQRKNYAKRGERSQKLMTFRIDNDKIEYLNTKTNKGRYINDLIEKDILENVNKTGG